MAENADGAAYADAMSEYSAPGRMSCGQRPALS
jgi:hypothetical protein